MGNRIVVPPPRKGPILEWQFWVGDLNDIRVQLPAAPPKPRPAPTMIRQPPEHPEMGF